MAGEPALAPATTVLVVEDDDFVRGVLARQLKSFGIQAVPAADGEEGLRLLRERGPFDAVICDLQMPQMDGVQFLRHLAATQPDARVVLISAQEPKVLKLSEELARAHGLHLLGALAKPIAVADLQRLLSKVAAVSPTTRLGAASITADELRGAIERQEIQASVQPKIHTSDGSLAGAEALARWERPGQSPVYPDTFIPLAEATGLIEPLTDLMLRQALQACGDWGRLGVPTRIAINVAPVTLHRLELPDVITDMARGFGVVPEQVIIEVTESGLLTDEALSLDVLTRLKLRGISLSIDDFGTGFSSLKQLKRLPFSELKVDRSFVAAMVDDPDAARIVEANIRLARELGVASATAEGVETEAQLLALRRLGCAHAQGYYIAKPMPRADLPAWAERLARR
jgi:EAL domain-containing protein (putative c-di-GMP-specific phosphodiesterase class I)/ActR/RegA family two-component response regulator